MILHDSHAAYFRAPRGARPAGSEVTLRARADGASRATLRAWHGGETRYAMTPVTHPNLPDGVRFFEITLRLPCETGHFWYDFIFDWEDGGTCRCGCPRDLQGGAGRVCDEQPDSFLIVLYDPDFGTPAWLREGVVYQIFPDRFCRADAGFADAGVTARAEMPVPADSPVSAGSPVPADSPVHAEATFHADWNEPPLLDADPENGDNSALDFFGGNLRGIREKLPYLRDLGVTALYLNPVFQARSNHRYDTGDYTKIDPLLGTNADFEALCADARRQGIRVMLDGVFSHTGADSVYFDRWGRRGGSGAYQTPASPYSKWYHFDPYPEKYSAWWGIYTLPELDKNEPSCRDFFLNEKNGVAVRWLDAGASGWRLDVADELPMDYLRALRASVKRRGADNAVIGEVWEDASQKVSYGELRGYCAGDTLDGVMNYPLREAILAFLRGERSAASLARTIRHQQEAYPAPFLFAQLNVLGSHDRPRVRSALVGRGGEGLSRRDAGVIALSDAELAVSRERTLKAFRLVCALPGAPCVYYGDEAGMLGAEDPWNRGTYPWGREDAATLAGVRALLRARRDSGVLRTGFCEVRALSEDTLRVIRFAKGGRDAFGAPLGEAPVVVDITR